MQTTLSAVLTQWLVEIIILTARETAEERYGDVLAINLDP